MFGGNTPPATSGAPLTDLRAPLEALQGRLAGRPVEGPTLDDLAADPARGADLSPEAARTLLARCVGILAGLLPALLARTGSPSLPTETASLGRCLRPVDVAQLTGLEDAFVQELCRRGRFPGAFKEGKYWIIPMEAYERWRLRALDTEVSVALTSPRDGRRGTGDSEEARALPGRLRPPRRRPRNHREPVGERRPRDPRADGEAPAAPGAATRQTARDS